MYCVIFNDFPIKIFRYYIYKNKKIIKTEFVGLQSIELLSENGGSPMEYFFQLIFQMSLINTSEIHITIGLLNGRARVFNIFQKSTLESQP